MITANDKNQNKVAVEHADKNTMYYCPLCKEPLTNKAFSSKCVKPYFSHKQGTKCPGDWPYKDKSEWHRSWQELFPVECREVPIEYNGIRHIADVCVGKVIFEFQHSPISNEEIQARNQFYTAAGYELIWIFDANNNIKNVNGKSIDPLQCNINDLQWNKRAIKHLGAIPDKVYIFLEYTIDAIIGGPIYIKLNSLNPLIFQKTSCRIFQESFLRQFSPKIYSSLSLEKTYPTVSEILFPQPKYMPVRIVPAMPHPSNRYELVSGKNGRIYSRKRRRL